jgi:hypothetical protein
VLEACLVEVSIGFSFGCGEARGRVGFAADQGVEAEGRTSPDRPATSRFAASLSGSAGPRRRPVCLPHPPSRTKSGFRDRRVGRFCRKLEGWVFGTPIV